jgi:hypothetical protein
MTKQNSTELHRSSPTMVGNFAIVCFSYSLLALSSLHFLKRDYVIRSHMISDYAVGSYGWVMTTVFLSMSCGLLMLLLGLFRYGPATVVARIGTLLLVLPVIGLVVSAAFDTDLPGMPDTRAGDIHGISFLVNVLTVMLSTILISFSFGSDSRWRDYRGVALALTSLILVAFVLQFLTLHKGMPYGYTNRFFVIALFTWFLWTSNRLRSVSRSKRA